MNLVPMNPWTHAHFLDVGQIRELESNLARTSPEALMALAGQAVARLARAVAPHARRAWVACGPGNNGGDGLEAAIELKSAGMEVRVSLMADLDRMPPDAARALSRAHAAGVVIDTSVPDQWLAQLENTDLCIDALLGLGTNRAATGSVLRAIELLNNNGAPTLSVDVPSGLDPRTGRSHGGACVHARYTLTLLALKPGLLTGQGRDVCGQLWLAPLGANVRQQPCAGFTGPPADLPARAHASPKGMHGDVAVIGGGKGMTGASLLSGESALMAGAGRLFWCPLSLTDPMAAWSSNLMLRDWQSLDLQRMTVVCGCGGGSEILQVLPDVIRRSHRLVLDADALNAIAADPRLQTLVRARTPLTTVLTPHPLEAARLMGVEVDTIESDRLQAVRDLSLLMGACTVVLKGSGTLVAQGGERVYVNSTGNARLAVAGTGDVLAGLTGARMTQHADSFSASCAAVWEHGLIADRWPTDKSLSASSMVEQLQSPPARRCNSAVSPSGF
ncbi:MAG: NAD(P)H-hydrate dehydratase, partial [Limnohabitans sp.]